MHKIGVDNVETKMEIEEVLPALERLDQWTLNNMHPRTLNALKRVVKRLPGQIDKAVIHQKDRQAELERQKKLETARKEVEKVVRQYGFELNDLLPRTEDKE